MQIEDFIMAGEGEQSSPNERLQSIDESNKEKMGRVMQELETRRNELGVVVIGREWQGKQDKAYVFIAGVEKSTIPDEDKTREYTDHVVIAPEGPLAIRHYAGTEEGKEALEEFQRTLDQIWRFPGGPRSSPSDTRQDRHIRDNNFDYYFKPPPRALLSFGHPEKFMRDRLKYVDKTRTGTFTFSMEKGKETRTKDGGILVSALAIPDKVTVDEAFDASKARVEKMKMPSTERITQTQATAEIADSLLGKLGGEDL